MFVRRLVPGMTFARRPPRRLTLMMATWALTLVATAALAKTPEQACQSGRYAAAAKYRACEAKAHANYAAKVGASGALDKHRAALAKCAAKYTATWGKLQAAAAGTASTCDGPRFVDGGNGTVRDVLTALVWEKKTSLNLAVNFTDRHDADNFYDWSAAGSAADGTLFTDFLANLNAAGFAGASDWRLPTVGELQTILAEPHPCGISPCIDAVFGPTQSSAYTTATDLNYEQAPAFAADVWFDDGIVGGSVKTDVKYGRAVRGGL